MSDDAQKRIQAFNEELIPLLGKHRVGLAARPFLSPDGRMGANPILVDADKLPKQSEEKSPEIQSD